MYSVMEEKQEEGRGKEQMVRQKPVDTAKKK